MIDSRELNNFLSKLLSPNVLNVFMANSDSTLLFTSDQSFEMVNIFSSISMMYNDYRYISRFRIYEEKEVELVEAATIMLTDKLFLMGGVSGEFIIGLQVRNKEAIPLQQANLKHIQILMQNQLKSMIHDKE